MFYCLGIFGLSKISYLFTQCDYLLNEEIEPNTAIADGDVIKWWCDQLPRGLYFDIDDGTIYGRPQVIMSTHITIYASDDVDTISTIIYISSIYMIFIYIRNSYWCSKYIFLYREWNNQCFFK